MSLRESHDPRDMSSNTESHLPLAAPRPAMDAGIPLVAAAEPLQAHAIQNPEGIPDASSIPIGDMVMDSPPKPTRRDLRKGSWAS